MSKSRGFTLIEVLVALGIGLLLAALFIPQYVKVKDGAELATARQQVMDLQTAVDAWLTKLPIATARAQFAAGTSDYPANTTALLTVLKTYLSPDAQTVYTVDASDPTIINTETMKNVGAYMKIKWPGATWTQDKPRIEFFQP